MARTPWADWSAAAASCASCAGARPLRTTWQPAAAKRCAAARPNPCVEPVMRAQRPSSVAIDALWYAREGTMAVKAGWTGRVYEDFTVGDVYHHPLGRTVLPVDNSWFTLLTQNMNPIHFDHAYAAQTEFGKPLVDSTFTLALVTGQSTIDLSFNVMANLGWDEVRLPNPVFEGDTIYSRSE